MPKKPSDRSKSSTPAQASARPRAARKPKAMAAKSNGRPMPTTTEPTYDQIAEAAYHRFLQRGQSQGDAVTDWIEAERELKQRAR